MRMGQEFRAALFATSVVGLILAAAMLVPALVNFADGHDSWPDFAVASVLTGLVWLMIAVATRSATAPFTVRFGIILVNMMWWVTSVIAIGPLVMGPAHMSFADAFFETASGFTTTGSTVLTGLDDLDRGTLVWRSLLQWFGGSGILTISLIVLPFLNVGGLQLFRLESSDRSEKVLPRAGGIIRAIVVIYVAMTALCAIGYVLSGMSAFDAVNHAMTTLSTGGYSTHDQSMGYFQSNGTLWVGSFFMLLAGLPFTLFVALFLSRKNLRADPQIFWYVGIIAGAVALLFLSREGGVARFPRSAAEDVFDVISIITTTGFVAGDYTTWGALAAPLFFLLTFFGGCSGSTAGGLKIYRLIVLTKMVRGSLKQLIHPHGVFPMRYGSQRIDPGIFNAALVMSVAFAGILAVCTLVLGAQGNDFLTALSGSLTALANVGPGLGDIIGPAGTFAALPDASKLVLGAAMIVGRLEIMVVMALFMTSLWR
jgi:trk system potassium uptake protein TrkH